MLNQDVKSNTIRKIRSIYKNELINNLRRDQSNISMEEPVNQTSPNEGEVHLLDYLIILAKHSRMIIYVSTRLRC